MNKVPLISVFKVFGIFSFRFNSKSKLFETSSNLQYYGKFLTVLIQTFNWFCFMFRQTYIIKYVLTVNNTSFTTLITLHLDRILWMALNISTMSQIIFRAKNICQLLNAELSTNETWKNSKRNIKLYEQHCSRVKLMWSAYLYPNLIIGAINVYIYYGATKFGLFSFISHYLIFCQFFIGQFFELMIVEKVMYHAKALQLTASYETVKLYIEMQFNFLKISKRAVKLFQLNKYISVVLVQIACSSYLLVYYEMITRSSKRNYFRVVNWQLVLSVILVVCHSWHRLTKQVRNLTVQRGFTNICDLKNFRRNLYIIIIIVLFSIHTAAFSDFVKRFQHEKILRIKLTIASKIE